MGPKPTLEPQTLLKTDATTLQIKAEKTGHIRVNCAAWEDARVLLPGESLELRWRHGQVHLIRRDRVPEDAADAPRLAGPDDPYGDKVVAER